MEEIVGLSAKERARLVEFEQVKAGRQTVVAASKRQSLELCRTRLEGFGPTLAAEKLAEVGLRVSHETLRRWLIVAFDRGLL